MWGCYLTRLMAGGPLAEVCVEECDSMLGGAGRVVGRKGGL